MRMPEEIAFNELLTDYFGLSVSKFTVGTRCAVGFSAFLGQYKNEVGKGGCDSFTEGIAYYVHMLHNLKTWQHWAQPTFLCELAVCLCGQTRLTLACYST